MTYKEGLTQATAVRCSTISSGEHALGGAEPIYQMLKSKLDCAAEINSEINYVRTKESGLRRAVRMDHRRGICVHPNYLI